VARRLARHPGGRALGDHRGVGLRQVNVHEPDRLPRPADARHLSPARRRRLHALRQRARRDPQPPDRLRLPELQPARAVDGARERGPPHDLRQRALRRAAPARARAARGCRSARPRAAHAEPALRRAAAARRDRARPRERALAAPRRRADRQPRHALEHRDHGALPAAAPGTAPHDRRGHARTPHRRLHRAHRQLPRRADRLGRTAGTVPARHGGRTRMNFLWMTVVTALRAIRRNVLRSALTMLGVIIGVAAVLTMVSIGRGANAAVQQQIASLGNNLIMVIPGATTANGVHSSSGSAASITVADATAIAKENPAVADVAWAKRDVVQVVYGNQNWATAAHGVPPTYLSVRDWPLSAGRFFDQRDDAGASAVAVLGPKILGTVDMIVVSAVSADALPGVERQIRTFLRERHRIPPGQDDDFTVRDLNEIAEASKNASEVMMNLLLSVASVSLLVGGIGIMNIMLVSVTERTREIGVRLAVGARTGHILLQFLVEATALSLVGGAVGRVVGS